LIEAQKPFAILGDALFQEKLIPSPIEREKTKAARGQRIPSIFMRSYMLGDLDDVRTSRHRYQSLVRFIYRFFRNVCASQKFTLSDWNFLHDADSIADRGD